MHPRALRAVATVGLVAALVVGCTGQPAAQDDTAAPTTGATTTGSAAPSATPSPGSGSSGTAAAPSSATSTSATSPAGTAPAVLTPVLAEVSTEPVPVTGTDGRVYLAYELYLTNITSTPVTVDSVQALDADSGAALQSYSGADLLAHARVVGTAPGGEPAGEVVLSGGQLAIVWLDPSIADGSALPTSLIHQVRLTFATAPSPLIPAELTETVAATPVRSTPAPTIASPLEGPNWLNGNGCCAVVTPHRGAANPINGRFDFAERFAIDWVQLTPELTLITGDPTDLASYAYYGAPVHAVADGEIVAVYDELQDQVPGANPPEGSLTLDQYGGNYVVQRFQQDGQTYYAFYAHLKPGTAKAAVTVGRQVAAGDILGELGNSGNTDAPHLHFHLMDGPDPLASDGVPFVFESQALTGRAAGEDAVGPLFTGEPLALAAEGDVGQRTGAMPLYLDLTELSVPRSTPSGSTPPSTSSPVESATTSETTG